MRKVLSAILAMAVFLAPVNSTCFAATAYKTNKQEQTKEQKITIDLSSPIKLEVSENGKKEFLKANQEDKKQPIIINNNINAKAEAKSVSKSESGGGKFLGLMKILAGLVGVGLAKKFVNEIIAGAKGGFESLAKLIQSVLNRETEPQVKDNFSKENQEMLEGNNLFSALVNLTKNSMAFSLFKNS